MGEGRGGWQPGHREEGGMRYMEIGNTICIIKIGNNKLT
jgi:hypothetical protein